LEAAKQQSSELAFNFQQGATAIAILHCWARCSLPPEELFSLFFLLSFLHCKSLSRKIHAFSPSLQTASLNILLSFLQELVKGKEQVNSCVGLAGCAAEAGRADPVPDLVAVVNLPTSCFSSLAVNGRARNGA
jgi:hypothetical protein